ncbi:Actin- protein 6 [Coemansia sp. RSA 2336]|nr:Actin- protein 6 [Coemansia sp. RSA 2336]
MQTLVLDNGSFAIKCGYAEDPASSRTIPNFVMRTKRSKRLYIGDQVDTTADLSGLYYRSPFERGYLVHWDAELAVWDRVISDDVLACTPSETNLVLTEPVNNLRQIQRHMDEIVFEEYQFASLVRAPASRFSMLTANDLIYNGKSQPQCVLVVDVGHAFTHIVPYCDQRQISQGVRRVDVGGRLLTNYLKETVSFRYWDMMDETFIMNIVKEKCCFVSRDFKRDLEATRGCIGRRKGNSRLGLEYVLPDFTANNKCGFVLDDQSDISDSQLLPLCNERFAVPEALFYPMDVGIEQAGIHQAVEQAISACPLEMHRLLFANIIVTGGSANMPGLPERLQSEVQKLTAYKARVFTSSDPMLQAWQGACKAAAEGTGDWRLTKSQYEEMGAKHGKPILRDGSTGDWLGTFVGHKGAVWSAMLSPDTLRAVTASADYTVKVWNAITGQELVSLMHDNIVKSADFAGSNELVATGGHDKSVRIFDVNRPDKSTIAASHTAPVHSVKWTKHRNMIISADNSRHINIIDVRAPSVAHTLDTPEKLANISLTADGKTLACAAGKRVLAWDIDSFKLIKDFNVDYEVSVAAINPTRTRMVVGSKSDLLIRCCNFDTGKQIDAYKGHHGSVHDACFSPDGQVYATGSEDGTVRLWQANPGSEYGLWQYRHI